MWIAVALLLLLAGFITFVWIARKGRELRRNQPLPPQANHAFIEAANNAKREVVAPFYFGKSPESNVILKDARADFETCIFYHNKRFAIQVLTGAGILLLNNEEILAGYLRDGDVLEIAKQKFVFHCY